MIDGKPRLSEMRWWLTPHWSDGPSQKYAMFNARSETAENSRAFQGPFKYRRAVIPASSFIEWQKSETGKQPYLIEPEEGVLAFGAIWDHWSDGIHELLSCSILTTSATDSFSPIHNRMPVILDQEKMNAWLDEKTDLEEIKSMLVAYSKRLRATKISTSLNNARNKSVPELVDESIAV